jgi:hypothetical protein
VKDDRDGGIRIEDISQVKKKPVMSQNVQREDHKVILQRWM